MAAVAAKYIFKFGTGFLCTTSGFRYIMPLILPLVPIMPINIFIYLIVFLIIRFTPANIMNAPQEKDGTRKNKSSGRAALWSFMIYLLITIVLYYILVFTLCDVGLRKETRVMQTVTGIPSQFANIRNTAMNAFGRPRTKNIPSGMFLA